MQQFIKALRFNIAPNPANGLVYIQIIHPEEVQDICIYNISGQLINFRKINGRKEISIDTSSLPSDTYLIQATGGKGKQIELLKVQH